MRERASARAEALPSAAELTERAEGQRLLMEAVLGLDEAKREVVILRYYERLSSAEIARRQGVPAGTVRARLKRALDELRERLDERTGGDREQWQRALVPLAFAPERSAAAVGLASLLTGALMLKTFLAAGAIAAAVAFVLVAIGALEAPFVRPPAEPVTFTPLEDLPIAAVEPTGAEGRREAEVDVEAPLESDDAEAEARPVGTFRLRFVDGEGRPVPGVEVATQPRFDGSTAVSGADGRAAVLAWIGARRGAIGVRYARRGFASDATTAHGEPGCDVDLGDVRLRPGGAIEGRVVDGRGAPLADVRVWVDGEEVGSTAAGGLRTSEVTALGAVETRSDDDGRFRLSGVLVGEVRVHVESDDDLWRGTSGRVEVRAGEESGGLVIVAEGVPEGQRIEGIVLDPAGEPVPWAPVEGRWGTWLSSGSLARVAGRDGRFRFVLPKRVPLDIVVSDPDGAWTPVAVEGVEPGTLDLEVRFEATRTFKVALADRAGAPVERAVLVVESGDRTLQYVEGESPDGTYELRLPSEPFDLTVLAPGFAEARARGLDAAAVGEVRRVALERLPGIRGAVTAAGEPVEGATLTVHEVARQRVLVSGLPSRLAVDERARATSDAQGAFELTLRAPGRVVLRAEAPGYAAFETAAFEYDPGVGAAGLALALTEGGAIEGRVVASNGLRETHVVLASRGDGRVRTVRTGVDGRYRIERLTPGPWMLRVVADEVLDGASSSSSGPGSAFREIPADCVVTEGETTIHDIFLRDGRPGVTLEGRLRVAGGDASAWSAELVPLEDAGRRRGLESSARLAPDGSFALEASAPGRHALLLVRGDDGDSALRVLVELDLAAGETAYDLELAMGVVVVGAGADREAERLLWRGPGGATGYAELPEAGTTLRFPAGTVERVRLDPSLAAVAADPREWPIVESATLEPGGTLRIAE